MSINESGPADAAAEADYLRAVEDRFRRLRARPLVLSPEDARIAIDWFRTEIPIALVFEKLDELFARAADRPHAQPRSLAYCNEAIQAAWAHRRELAVGGGSLSPRPRVASRRHQELYREAAAEIERSRAPQQARSEAAARLLALASAPSGGIQGDPILAVEHDLVSACLDSLGGDDRARLRAEAEQHVGAYAESMTREIYELAVRSAETRLVRTLFRVPDLSRLPLPPG